VKRNSQQKSTLTETDHRSLRIVSKNHTTRAPHVTAKLNTHPEDPVSSKTLRREIRKSNMHGRAATAKPLITESNAQMRKRWCHGHETWTPDYCKRVRNMVR
jgi:hypothetical protein